MISLCVLTAGASYAAVPLYRIFCQTSGYGGTTQIGHDADKVETMETKKDRLLTIKFTADTAATMQWNFRPQQYSIDVYAGETALAFYTVSQIGIFLETSLRPPPSPAGGGASGPGGAYRNSFGNVNSSMRSPSGKA